MNQFPYRVAVLSTILCLTSSCSDLGESPESSISYQEARWKSFNLHSYSFTQRRGCFCPGPYLVSMRVVQDAITQVVDLADSSEVSSTRWSAWYTVDRLFQFAKDVKSEDPYQFNIQFDPTYGYPSYLYVHFSLDATGDELLYICSNLVPM